MLRSAENGKIHELIVRKPDTDKTSGVKFGVSGLGTGSGLGPQITLFHRDVLGRGIEVELPLLYTYSQYQMYGFTSRVPLIGKTVEKGLSFDVGTSYVSRAKDDFYGIGNDSPDDKTEFRTVTRQALAGFSARWNDDWSAGVHAVYRSVGVTKPTSGTSTQSQFDSTTVPGLFGATLRSVGFSISRDTETRAKHAFKGGSDLLEISFNDSVGSEPFQYWRYHLDSQHFFWLTSDGRKVIAARGLLETNVPTSGHEVPFFDMPFVGSNDTLRGFNNFRFRDSSALSLTLEYRYRIWPQMDWGFFVDEGQVAPHVGDFGFNQFHTGYGVRLFVWPTPNLPIAFDVAHSNEAWRFYVNINTKF